MSTTAWAYPVQSRRMYSSDVVLPDLRCAMVCSVRLAGRQTLLEWAESGEELPVTLLVLEQGRLVP
jgi:hypothetical protein